MKLAVLVTANPNPQSFSHAAAAVAARVLADAGYELAAHDLYTEHFDPVQPVGESANTSSADHLVERHCAELSRADL
ncbi:MAG: NAD(P)H-dependent oxidoreductase, partial [Rhodanobacter sp.]|nr:NAD(P)H-dependent oxidoreductase [Rhodanobacter sp.]